jgi:hypothetical protein
MLVVTDLVSTISRTELSGVRVSAGPAMLA